MSTTLTSQLRGLLAAAAVAAVSASCRDAQLTITANPPTTLSSSATRRVVGHLDFVPSSVASGRGCELIVVGAVWGTIIKFDSSGAQTSTVSRVPGFRSDLRFGNTIDSKILIRSQYPAFLGEVDVATLQVDSMPIPEHPWGGAWLGPSIELADRSIVIAGFGGRSYPIKQPPGSLAAPEVRVFAKSGEPLAEFGHVHKQDGSYLASFTATLSLGYVSDTVQVLRLEDALLRRLYFDRSTHAFRLTQSKQLPTYFRAPNLFEQVVSVPWLQINSDLYILSSLPAISVAAIGPMGKIYAVRTYNASWRAREASVLFKSGGSWTVTSRALEIYEATGKLMGSYSLGDLKPIWMQIGNHGQIFLGDDSKDVTIVQDPTSDDNVCAGLPAVQKILASDVYSESANALRSLRSNVSVPFTGAGESHAARK